MNFSFLCLVITLYSNLLGVHAKYNKDVVCIINRGTEPVCAAVDSPSRRFSARRNNIPLHDPYIPRSHSLFYNCSAFQCEPIQLTSLIQLLSPGNNLKSCYNQAGQFQCENTRFQHFKTIDKLLFLNTNIRNRTFYLVDCLVFHEGGRVCHRRVEQDTLKLLVEFGKSVRPNETNVLSQEEFLCEENENKEVNCDFDSYIPFDEGLKRKESYKVKGDVMLRSGVHSLILNSNCIDSWCGFSGHVPLSRRSDWFTRYEPPGGKIFRCYFAKRQQVCKMIGDSYINSVANNNPNNWMNR